VLTYGVFAVLGQVRDPLLTNVILEINNPHTIRKVKIGKIHEGKERKERKEGKATVQEVCWFSPLQQKKGNFSPLQQGIDQKNPPGISFFESTNPTIRDKFRPQTQVQRRAN